ncbi:hypothetical protein WMY93_024652 [Mugilogobius chulae]|uniref:Ig-like domain-containing protein n=1 Tax=Mugilogobius chulae TaxID=88201 RepID=A0AAW0NB87_9GOBI
MALLMYSRFMNKKVFHCFYAQLQWVMRVALWSFGLSFCCFFTFSSSVDEECVVGIVGHPVLLPCFLQHELLSFQNLSVEWRKGSELILKAEWDTDGDVETWSLNYASIPGTAPLTGNFSLALPKVNPKEDEMIYSLFLTSEEGNVSAPLCSVCLRMAARFSSPLLQRDETTESNRTVFLCQSSGGFPKPTVYWLINDTEQPPEDSVWTDATHLPDSSLYNVTSLLKVNLSKDDSVSCSIQNQWMNETLTSRSKGAKEDTIRGRASEGLWMFSTGLCVAVGILVGAGVGYQIHLDRISKKRRVLYESTKGQRRNKKHQFIEETETIKTEEETMMSKESCV